MILYAYIEKSDEGNAIGADARRTGKQSVAKVKPYLVD